MKKYFAGILTVLIPIIFSLYVPEIREFIGLPDIYLLIKDRENLILKVDELNDKIQHNNEVHAQLIEEKDSIYNILASEIKDLKFNIDHFDSKFIGIDDLFNYESSSFLDNLHTIIFEKEHELADEVNCTRINFMNSTNKSISVSIHYRSVLNIWVTKGWYNVEPNETIKTNVYITGNQFYTYAQGGEKGGVWSGEKTLQASEDKFFHIEKCGLVKRNCKKYRYSLSEISDDIKTFTLNFIENK